MFKTMLMVTLFLSILSYSFADAPPAFSSKLFKTGETIYTTHCITCHPTVPKDFKIGTKLDLPPAGVAAKSRNFSDKKEIYKNGLELTGIRKTIEEGIPNTGMIAAKMLMGRDLSADETWGIAWYIRKTFTGKTK